MFVKCNTQHAVCSKAHSHLSHHKPLPRTSATNLCLVVNSLSLQVLQPISAHPTAEVSGLTAAITSAAGGSSDNAVETDAVLELLAAAWSSQRAAEQQQLERLVAQSDAPFKGLANQEEFAGLVKQVWCCVFGVGLTRPSSLDA